MSMKNSQKLLGFLLIISALCAMHSTYSADSQSWRSSLQKTVERNSRALWEYTLAPELTSRKLYSLASLAVPCVVETLSAQLGYDSYSPLLTSLASLAPLYAAYEASKDLSIIRNIQLAQEGETIPTEDIEEYMYALLDINNRPNSVKYSGNTTQFTFKDDTTRMALMWRVIRECRKDDQKKDLLKECARQVLISKGFEYPYELTDRNYYEVDTQTRNRNRGIDIDFTNKWGASLAMLRATLNNNFQSFEDLRFNTNDRMISNDMFMILNELGFDIDTFDHIKRLNMLTEDAKNGEEIKDATIKLSIRSLFDHSPLGSINISFCEKKNHLIAEEKFPVDHALPLKHREILASYYTQNTDQIKACTYQVLNDLNLIYTSEDRIYIAPQAGRDTRVINIMLHALLSQEEGEIIAKDNFKKIKIFNYDIINKKTALGLYDVTHLFDGFRLPPGPGYCTKRASRS